jgi:CheY-like chemotaxis protein
MMALRDAHRRPAPAPDDGKVMRACRPAARMIATAPTARPAVAWQEAGVRVLVVEKDPVLGDVVEQVLVAAGYVTTVLPTVRLAAVRAAVERLESDCVLLDGGSRIGYDTSWEVAAWLGARPRPVPTVMFTPHTADAAEVESGTTPRSRHFAGVQPKPFDLDELGATVARAAAAA